MYFFLKSGNQKYSSETYEAVVSLFETLPLCCIIDSKYFCVHAGISPSLTSLSIKLIILEQLQALNRFMEIPDKGLLCDLLWSDPVER